MPETKETTTLTRSQKEISEDGNGVAIKDKLSIQQILEGMTNEFNKPGTKKQTDSVKKFHNKVVPPVRKLERAIIKVTEEVPKVPKVVAKINKPQNNGKEEEEEEEEVKIIKENIPEEKQTEKPCNGDEALSKLDTANKNRIVLTFKTIDENTGQGKKTKISSCPSNLTLVPDELNNCNQIGGVSVRIENLDDPIGDVNKSVPENNQEPDKKEKLPSKQNEEEKKRTLVQKEVLKIDESMDTSLLVENHQDGDFSENSSLEKVESNLFSRKIKQKDLRDSGSDELGLKRSARRLSKECPKSTVLESAMARKEKFNYTEETSKRKYTKPGRPKKLTPEKKELPKLNPIDPSMLIPDRKPALPKLCPLNSLKKINPISHENTTTNLSNKYEGMPKLTPIIKSCEIIQSISELDEAVDTITLKSNSQSKNFNGVFLKPSFRKSNQDKSRPRVISISKRGAIKISNESSPSSSDSGALMDDVEDNSTPAKRTRRSTAASPSTAEGLASKPESAAVLNKKEIEEFTIDDMQCLCEARSQLYVTIASANSPLYCTALDSVDNKVIGCSNQVDRDDVAMRRPSAQIPYIILCRLHKQRMVKHNCCPTCGLFCAQGKFIHCSNGHQYHRDCELLYEDKALCPHCASYGISYEVIITLNGKRNPSSTQTQKSLRKGPTAKITLPGEGDNTKLAEQQPLLKKSTEPLIDPRIEIPQPSISTEKTERYTYAGLYSAVKNGDLQKLVNILANGFNANHAFRDQSHKTSLHVAAEKGFLACAHVLVQAGAQLDVLDRNQLSPLMLAALNGKSVVVKYLMRVGADITLKGEDGMTGLHMAAKSGHLDTCKIILNECKVPRTLVDLVDDGGWTSLIWACEFRHADVARFLLENKCDPLIRDAEQNIALHWSAFSGCSEVTELLLDMGCDPNAVNVHGDTPLHIASRQDQYAVSVLLLSRGAKIGEVNSIGETAIDCCKAAGNTLNALQLNYKLNQRADKLSERTVRILTNDISRGKETNPVQCVNGFDSEDKPTDFVYVTENCFTSKVNIDRTITSLQSCRCEDTCNSDKCLCGNISLRCWYDEEGKLVPEFNYTDPPMIFECNPACDCNKITCNNRVVQHGITQRFQLFRTKDKGWGIKTLRHIAKGSYVCEYVGEIISDSEADHREDDSYLFDLDNRDGETYCIDARRYGNLARFINHACAPNLLPVRLFIEHQDLHFPRIAFFANRDIEAEEELGFDYGEKFWIIKCKSFTCTCGAENCRYSDKTIQATLDNYRKKLQHEEQLAAQNLKTQKT